MLQTVTDSPLGPITLVSEQAALVGVYLDGQRHRPVLELERDDDAVPAAREQLAAFFAGTLTTFDLPLAPVGTPFQKEVWAALQTVPYGTTTTYGRLAASLGRPGASRAVGLANGRNPICLVVPCHRVVGADGSLTGYAGGVERKRWLIDHEAGVSTLSG